MPRLIGLTGNMGCGKSKVANILSTLPRVTTLSADDIAKDVVLGKEYELQIRMLLNLQEDLSVTRETVGRIIFNDQNKRRMIESFVGPFLWGRVSATRAVAAPDALIIVESALIYELNEERRFDAVVVAACPATERFRRLVEHRALQPADIKKRSGLQLAQEELIRRATYVIDTDCPLAELDRRVRGLYQQLLSSEE